MIIIGEKINGAIPSVGKAIAERDADFIKDLAVRQAEAGADYLDVCASVGSETEVETLQWMLDQIQSVTETPICIDSPDPETIVKILPYIHKPGMINSVSGEGKKCDIIFPAIRGTEWKVIALTNNDNGLPTEPEQNTAIAVWLIEKAAEYDITPERIFIDPLVLSMSTNTHAMLNFVEAVHNIKKAYPTVNITSGLSNISYSLPYRKIINQNFLAISMFEGMNSAIVDPLNRDMIATIMTVEMFMNHDRFCRKYIKAFRSGMIGPTK